VARSIREALAGGEATARVDHVRPPAGGAGHARERPGEVDGPEHDQPWRRRGHVDEQRHVAHLAPLRSLGPHQLFPERDGGGVEFGDAERPLDGLVRPDQQTRVRRARDDGHERRPLGDRELGLQAHGS
jgi:hypothetical protein